MRQNSYKSLQKQFQPSHNFSVEDAANINESTADRQWKVFILACTKSSSQSYYHLFDGGWASQWILCINQQRRVRLHKVTLIWGNLCRHNQKQTISSEISKVIETLNWIFLDLFVYIIEKCRWGGKQPTNYEHKSREKHSHSQQERRKKFISPWTHSSAQYVQSITKLPCLCSSHKAKHKRSLSIIWIIDFFPS